MAGRFSVEAVIKAVDRVTAPVSKMQNSVLKFSRTSIRSISKLNRGIGNLGSSIASTGRNIAGFAAVGVGAVTGAVTLLVREFSKIENAEAAFTPLLGSVARAKQAVQALNDTAATTPFQFEDLASVANQLLPVMNGNIEKTIKTLRMLGDTAGGNAQKLDTITRGFTKAMLKGKVDMESLNMIAEAGVPIFADLAEVIGVDMGEAFFDMVSAGDVTTTHLTKAFEKMTREGGMFFNGMQVASKTTTGMWSTMIDNISLAAADIGEILAPAIKDLIQQVTDMAKVVRVWVAANRDLIKVKFLEFIETAINFGKSLVGVFKFLNEHGKKIAVTVAVVLSLIAALKIFIGVMTAVNIVMSLNPIGLIIIGIAALIAAIAAVIIYWDELKAAFVGLPGPVKAAIAILGGPLMWLVGVASLIIANWEPLKDFFSGLWDGIVGIFEQRVQRIMSIIQKVKAAWGTVAGIFGDDDEQQGPQQRGVMGAEYRTSNTLVNRSEVLIRDQTGRAEVNGKLGEGLTLSQSGAF